MNWTEAARRALPNDTVEAAGVFFRPGAGRNQGALVAVTPTHVHLFAAPTTGRIAVPAEPPFATWRRNDLRASGQPRAMMYRLTLSGFGAPDTTIEAVKRNPETQEVLRTLLGSEADLPRPAGSTMAAVNWAEGPLATGEAGREWRTRVQLVSAGFAAGAVIVVLGTLLPWLMFESVLGTSTIAGSDLVGWGYYLLAGFAILEGVSMLIGRQFVRFLGHAPLLTAGILTWRIVSDYLDIQQGIREAEATGLTEGVTAGVGSGFWVSATGVAIMIVTAILMRVLRQRAETAAPAPMPPPPPLPS